MEGLSHTHTHAAPATPLPPRLPRSRRSSPCSAVGPWGLSILNTAECMRPSQTPRAPFLPPAPQPRPADVSSVSRSTGSPPVLTHILNHALFSRWSRPRSLLPAGQFPFSRAPEPLPRQNISKRKLSLHLRLLESKPFLQAPGKWGRDSNVPRLWHSQFYPIPPQPESQTC